jgi:hypothetical protein
MIGNRCALDIPALQQNLWVVRWTTNVGRQVFSGITGQKERLSGTFDLTFKKRNLGKN